MRKALLLPVALAACSTAPAANGPVAPDGDTAACRSDKLAAFAGREATGEVGAEILRVSGARVLRWVQPGMMVTMEFRADRITIWLAPGNKIERVSCG